MTGRQWWFGGLLGAVAIAALLTPFASPWPDGLDRVAAQLGFRSRERVRPIVRAALAAPVSGHRQAGADRRLFGRLALLLPFFLLLLVSTPFMTPGSVPPLVRAGTAAARAVIGFGALAAALRRVEPPELLHALARL